jgi:GH24 family phage-related lysozyme (muramidase)
MEKLKQALIAFCRNEGISVVFGSENKITVKEQDLLKFPLKNTAEREELISSLKQIGKWDEVVELDVSTLARILKRGEWPEPELEMLKRFGSQEKTYRLSVGKK